MRLKMIRNKVAIKPLPHKKEYFPGFIIPEAYCTNRTVCKVLAVGPGVRDKKGRLQPVGVQKGELVIVQDNKAFDQAEWYEGRKRVGFFIIEASDILLVVDDLEEKNG